MNDLTNTDVKNIFKMTTSEQADLNFAAVKKFLNADFSIKAASDLNAASFFLSKPIEENIQILKDYIELCLANDAKPIGVVFPFAPVVREIYSAELLNNFRETIRQIEESSPFKCVDMFDLDLDYDCFRDTTHLNIHGTIFTNTFLSLRLYEEGLIPIESFCDVTYEKFDKLSHLIPAQEYNNFLEKVFEQSAQRIRRKDKIKLAFVLYDTSMWSGDKLYNHFAQDDRFDTTVFLYRTPKVDNNELIQDDFSKGVEQFESHGINVITVNSPNETVPKQDVAILLTPYPAYLPKAFRLGRLSVKTLVAHISYSVGISIRGGGYYNRRIFHTSWRIFFSSVVDLNLYAKKSLVGMPRGIYSGHPKTDIFFDQNINFHFEWKMARPDAKKIIWAPHHSIPEDGVHYATFQWNYQFMYEFAKSHPEISWIVKPHPALPFRVINAKIFPSDKDFKEYMQKWDELPNAQVYTGAYYQAIFATSDGMIHDSGSFIAEYQFVDKPMIYLTRQDTKYNELGNAILEASYLVDGKNFDAIAAMIQRVFIEGDDYKATERKEVFDKYLNYPKANGMLASEFIYHSIADELKEEPK